MEIYKTELFSRWLVSLRDIQAKARIQARIDRLADGNPGDVKPVAEGISEMRIHYGSGYRIYFKTRRHELIILLAGGDKSTQATDIKQALSLAKNLRDLP
jgi:putative addiction module killer protein